MKKKIKEVEQSKDEVRVILQKWLDNDMVKATFVCHFIEKHDPAFIRGVRYGLYQAIRELEK